MFWPNEFLMLTPVGLSTLGGDMHLYIVQLDQEDVPPADHPFWLLLVAARLPCMFRLFCCVAFHGFCVRCFPASIDFVRSTGIWTMKKAVFDLKNTHMRTDIQTFTHQSTLHCKIRRPNCWTLFSARRGQVVPTGAPGFIPRLSTALSRWT